MTELTEKNLLLAHNVLADPFRPPAEFTPTTMRHELLARYLDERDAADAQREAEYEAFRDEVERVVSEALTFAASEDIGPLLRSLIRTKPEPDLLAEALSGLVPEISRTGDETHAQALARDLRIELDKLGLELVCKGDAK